MNWIDKLERRYGSLGIPNLINGLLIGQLAAGIIMLFFNRDFGSLLMLSRTMCCTDRFGALSRFCSSHLAGRRLWRAEPAVLLLAGQRAGPCLGRFPHDAVSGAGHARCVGQLLSDRLRRAERHLPEHAVRLYLAVAGSDGAAVWHHSVQDEIPGWIELAFWAFSFLTGSFAIKVSLVLGLAGFWRFMAAEVFDWCVDA